MKKMRFHLLSNGVPLKQIQDWLGHWDFSAAANLYAKLDDRWRLSLVQEWECERSLLELGDFGR